MRKAIVILVGLAILVLVNHSIYTREKLLTDGDVVVLRLAPVDPRSLMQGDYMALRFQIEGDVGARVRDESPHNGHVVLALDERGVGAFARIDDGTPLAANEVRMRYRLREKRIKFATNAFFFQEGHARLYENARFGEFRVGRDGESILTGMRDGELALLGPGK
ncbi:MAG TPA: GDYXXLXY domain-containing protein [Burkholderiales bacterium]|nr:GDYXXLXY domain-containing protein [Burkholderiales bacterium]